MLASQPCCHPSAAHALVSRSARRYVGINLARARPARQRLCCFAEQQGQKQGPQDGQDKARHAPKISLRIPYHVAFGQCLAIVGSGEHLGNWNPDSAIKMTWTEGDYWVAELQVQANSESELEYKYLVLNSDGNLGLWKPGSNFRLDIPPGARLIKVHETWVDGPRHVEIDSCCLNNKDNHKDASKGANKDASGNNAPKASDAQLLTGGVKSAIQRQTDVAMEELEYVLEQQCTSMERTKDPAANDLINGDRILAAASNKAMAFNKASKAAEILPQLPGTTQGQSRPSLNA